MLSAINMLFHILGAVIWIGGMFFAHVALRPAALEILEPPQRLMLWNGVLKRFFFWVWHAIILLWISGLWRILGEIGGFAHVKVSIHIMLTLGLIMTSVFFYIFFARYPLLKQSVAIQNWLEAKNNLDKIRSLVFFNLNVGILAVAIATAGHYGGF
jgi:uncharacterized membrane protein